MIAFLVRPHAETRREKCVGLHFILQLVDLKAHCGHIVELIAKHCRHQKGPKKLCCITNSYIKFAGRRFIDCACVNPSGHQKEKVFNCCVARKPQCDSFYLRRDKYCKGSEQQPLRV